MERAADIYKFSSETTQMFAEALECIYKIINSSSANQILVTIDTLENYNLPNLNVDYAIGGLMHAIDWVKKRSKNRVKVTCCLPAELFHQFGEFSEAPLKVFADRLGLRWSNAELIDIAATRYKKYLHLYYPSAQKDRDELVKTSAGCVNLIERALRPEGKKTVFLNRDFASVFSFAEDETALTYIMRHTQSLPRHVIVLLNSIWLTEQKHHRGSGPHINSQNSIFEGVRDALGLITFDIIKTFKFSRPHAQEYCENIIPLLPPVFSQDHLKSVFDEHYKNTHHKYKDFISTLIEVGILGHCHRTEDRKHYAQFEYQMAGQMNRRFKTMAIHPMFSQQYCDADALYNHEEVVYPELPR